MLIHASCVAIEGKAVLLSGTSGVGKSDLALRLIDRGASLVSDDQTVLHCEGGILCASPPSPLQGLIEVRHLGLLKIPFVVAIPVLLYVELVPSGENLERLPDAATVFFLDHNVQQLRLPAFAASTPAKIRAALFYSTLS